MSRVKVMLLCVAEEVSRTEVEDAYGQVSTALQDTPGLLSNELLWNRTQPGHFIVLSEWQDSKAFLKWESGPDHRATTKPMRRFQDRSNGSPFALYEVGGCFVAAAQSDPSLQA